ncbi:MAG: CDP-alcohol phosphatidyltransferase family protein [Anaerolineales bacterium]|uniref:CDP-alcohol phosphatidyltransferase family protein n=1 Tax=Candidatus Desulfolinea nitratireducens TaxID=2841698 RepID=A0A8J6TF37_9CHLR|nr:CDP-alcohol phosphatidyltransferase family protein [Candidatus Desulfolinea nitratireducens]MBL6960392.1 CDP-alcohol phosphatidyltransferase family protein [Anaerolineales bacterium]
MSLSTANTTALTNLKKDWMRTGLFFILLTGAGYFLLDHFWEHNYALRWLGLTAALAAWQLIALWQALPQNHRAGEYALLPDLGLGNQLSLVRGFFIAALAGFLFSPWPFGWLGWVPAFLYFFSDITDLLDGYFARIQNHVTELGAALDMNNDSWGVLVVTGLAFWYGQVPVWYLPVGLARYFFLAGLWIRERQGKENLELPHSFRRRIFAGVQMGLITAMLVPLFAPPATTIAATLFMIPFLGGFLYDWFLVTGKIDPEKGAVFFENLLSSAWMRLLPLGLRILTAAGLAYLALLQPVDIFGLYQLPFGPLWLILEIIVILMLIFGVMGRLAAVFALVFLGLMLKFTLLTPLHFSLLLFSAILLFTGSGALSIWSPEEWLIYHRAGEDFHA